MKMNKHKRYEICDYSLHYDPKKTRTFMHLTAYHDDFMKNHEIVYFHGIEQMEMENMRATMYALATVSDINETNQTDSIGSWAFTLKNLTYTDLKKMDEIIEQ